jgi:hypothetical protein
MIHTSWHWLRVRHRWFRRLGFFHTKAWSGGYTRDYLLAQHADRNSRA